MKEQSDRAKRLDALRSRITHEETTATKPVSSPKEKPKRNRDRHTLYLDRTIVGNVDKAYKVAAHELFPIEINKSDYLEACLSFALAHQEDIKAKLAEEIPAENQ